MNQQQVTDKLNEAKALLNQVNAALEIHSMNFIYEGEEAKEKGFNDEADKYLDSDTAITGIQYLIVETLDRLDIVLSGVRLFGGHLNE